jgi:16S rRNA processing protein RimM
VKVIPETDDPARLLALRRVWLGASVDLAGERAVVGARFQTSKRGLTVLLQLAGVASREAAELLRRQRVYALEADLPPADDAGPLLHDLAGWTVLLGRRTPASPSAPSRR